MIGLEYRGYRVDFLSCDNDGFYGEAYNDRDERVRFFARDKNELKEAFKTACDEAIGYREYCEYGDAMAEYLQAQYFDEMGYQSIDF